jgi:hypothetical protein
MPKIIHECGTEMQEIKASEIVNDCGIADMYCPVCQCSNRYATRPAFGGWKAIIGLTGFVVSDLPDFRTMKQLRLL